VAIIGKADGRRMRGRDRADDCRHDTISSLDA
jgi:hypothetical protein